MIQLLDKLVFNKNNDSKPVFSKNNSSQLVSEWINSNNKFNGFGNDNIKHIKKSEKLPKLGKSKSEKLAMSKKLSKVRIFLILALKKPNQVF